MQSPDTHKIPAGWHIMFCTEALVSTYLLAHVVHSIVQLDHFLHGLCKLRTHIRTV
jgi:hypothetical protein